MTTRCKTSWRNTSARKSPIGTQTCTREGYIGAPVCREGWFDA
ncbi:hypothetical protein [Gluconobacter potus]|nr:hypothetical protein [Gluconobacter potus]